MTDLYHQHHALNQKMSYIMDYHSNCVHAHRSNYKNKRIHDSIQYNHDEFHGSGSEGGKVVITPQSLKQY